MLGMWIAGCALLLFAFLSRKLENYYVIEMRRRREQHIHFGITRFWYALLGVVEKNEYVINRMGLFEGIIKRSEIKFIKSVTDLIALTILGSIGLGVLVGLLAFVMANSFVIGILIGIPAIGSGLVLIPISFKAEENKKNKLLDKEVRLSYPMFRTFAGAGARGKYILESMSLSQPDGILKRRIDEMLDLIREKGYSYLEAMKYVAAEWKSLELTHLVDLIEKAEQNKTPISEEINRHLEQNKESEMLDAEAAAAGKEQITLLVCIACLFGPGMLFILSLTLQYMNSQGQ